MSASISIFIEYEKDIEKTVSDIQIALGVKLEPIPDSEYHSYQHVGLGFVMTLYGNHGLEDDKDISFSKYQYEIDFDEIRGGIRAEYWENLQYYVAMYSYSKIVKELKCPAMIVDDLQELIASYP